MKSRRETCTMRPFAVISPLATGRTRWMLNDAVRTHSSSTRELTAKNAASSSALKYTAPCTASAAWNILGSTAIVTVAAPSSIVSAGR